MVSVAREVAALTLEVGAPANVMQEKADSYVTAVGHVSVTP
jgi:hypothetical protein